MWKPSRPLERWIVALAISAGLPILAVAHGADDYRSVVEAFATTPDAAVGRMLAMPRDEIERGVREATRTNDGWPTEALDPGRAV